MKKLIVKSLKFLLGIVALVILIGVVMYISGAFTQFVEPKIRHNITEHEKYGVKYLFTVDSCKVYRFKEQGEPAQYIKTCPADYAKLK